VSELKPDHGTPLDRIVNEGGMLKRIDVDSVGPGRDQAVAWGDTFDVFPNPFSGRDQLMTGADYERMMDRYARFFRRAGTEDVDPLERDHSLAAIAELRAPVRHPDREEGDNL